jgi:hypothetical protein
LRLYTKFSALQKIIDGTLSVPEISGLPAEVAVIEKTSAELRR